MQDTSTISANYNYYSEPRPIIGPNGNIMAEMIAFVPPTFDWKSDDLPSAFKNFMNYCKLIFSGPLSAKNELEKVTYILLWMGQEGINVYETWELTAKQKSNPDEIFSLFQKHFEPKTNFRLARYKLQQMRQDSLENVDEFMTRCKLQAEKCKFDACELKVRLIEQLIVGTPHKKVQEKLLCKDEKLTLDDALDVARTYEATKAHMSAFSATATGMKVDSLKGQKTHNSNRKCNRCGLKFPHKGDCPAMGSKCFSCGKLNHWRAMCKSKPKENNRHRPTGSSNSNRFRSKHRSRSRNRSERPSSNTLSRENHNSESLGVEQIKFEVIKINNIQGSKDPDGEIFATLNTSVEEKQATLKVKVDTGAEGNILPMRIFKSMYPHKVNAKGKPLPSAPLQPSDTIITAYNGSRINHHGMHFLDCAFEGNNSKVKFYVTDVDGPAVLGLNSCLKLKLVTLNCNLNLTPSSIRNIDDLKRIYPDRFQGIGKFEGEYIVCDKSVPPVVHAPRRCPVQISGDVKKELDDMVSLGVIESVTEPTDWVSSLVYCRKPNGRLRVCLDPKDLNKAIKRGQCHIPTHVKKLHSN